MAQARGMVGYGNRGVSENIRGSSSLRSGVSENLRRRRADKALREQLSSVALPTSMPTETPKPAPKPTQPKPKPQPVPTPTAPPPSEDSIPSSPVGTSVTS